MIDIEEKKTSKKDYIRYIVIVVILLSLVFIVSSTNLFSIFVLQGEPDDFLDDVGMVIDSPDWSISYLNISTDNVTVAGLLFECADVYGFSVGKSYFSGYDSYFIDDINGVTNGDGDRYWQYYVNGEFADMGCSQYLLYDGDLVEWRFEVPDWLV